MTTTFENKVPSKSRSSKASRHAWAVLLAGGDGVRLRDLTRRITGDSRPKQFCPLIGRESLLRQTQARLEPIFRRDRQMFVLSRAHEPYYGELADTSDACVLEQPLNRGTGVAIALATVHILSRDPDAVIGFFPCDHYYANDDSFRSTIRLAAAGANRHPEAIILVGAEAEYPEVEYGWIEPGPAVSQAVDEPLFQVHRFWEKPPLPQARALLNSGCLWNTFVTVGRATAFLDLFCSQDSELVRAIIRAVVDSNLESLYHCLPAMDFSRDVLAHQPDRLLVLRDRASGWADLGSQDRVIATLERMGIQPKWFSSPESNSARAGANSL